MANSIISILTISQNRVVARDIAMGLKPHNFMVNGILEMSPYNSRDLALALGVLEPRPQAVIMGRGYTEEEANQAREVFATYMKEVGVANGTVIKITQEVFEEVGREGISKWVQAQLERHFRQRQ